ncbi:MAG: molybdenum cofactor guanylyltransferase [Planctomycetota bacterium]
MTNPPRSLRNRSHAVTNEGRDDDTNKTTSDSAGLSCGGVLLCGGRSVRMGEDKALLTFGGELATFRGRFIERAERALSFVAREIILSTNRPDAYAFLNRRAVPDLRLDELAGLDNSALGPLGGLAAGIEALPNCKFIAVVACDVPFLSGATLARMLDLARADESVDAVIPFTEHGAEPLVAIYRSRVARILRSVLALGVRRIVSNPLPRGLQMSQRAFTTKALPIESLTMHNLQKDAIATKAALDFVNIHWTPAEAVAGDPLEFANINDPEEFKKAADYLYKRGGLHVSAENERSN